MPPTFRNLPQREATHEDTRHGLPEATVLSPQASALGKASIGRDGGRLKVLIATADLFSDVGGGQTVYRKLIQDNPRIEFSYLGLNEPPGSPRPANAKLIPLVHPYRMRFAQRPRDTHPPFWSYASFIDASNLAASVAGEQFDLVELPDFRHFGSLLRPALKRHGVRFEQIVLSMHGRVSDSIRRDWGSPPDVLTLEHQERLQYRTADLRYGISRAYLDEWRQLEPLGAHYLDPLRVIEPPRPTSPEPRSEPPGLHFVGRTEKWKGPDLFLDLVWWLPRESYQEASIIGPECFLRRKRGSYSHLREMMAHRREVPIRPGMNRQQLATLFAARSVIVLPSRYDTLNLVALEALFAGCPTAIGSGAGVCRFLRESLPGIPFVPLNIANLRGCLPDIQNLLKNYDQSRDRLVEYLERTHPEIDGPTLAEIYASDPESDADARREMDGWYDQLMRHYEAWARTPSGLAIRSAKAASTLLAAAKRSKPKAVAANNKPADSVQPERQSVREQLAQTTLRGEAVIARHLAKGLQLAGRYQRLLQMPEESEQQVAEKLKACWAMAGEFRVDLGRIWTEIARLERLRGNDLMAAVYRLRVIRALGDDRFGQIPFVTSTLRRLGYTREAAAAEAMFGPAHDRHAACEELLDRAFNENRTLPAYQFQRLDDRRPSGARRVSVIVSLYRAADKLPSFLHAIANQTLAASGGLEIILVDSGSPDREYEVFREQAKTLALPIVYARSQERETILAAWNRGITLARAPYLSMLGVDETLLPDALETLAGELDRDNTLDWVIANSLLTRVDEQGAWEEDLLTYDRTDYEPTLPYLDTTYLSWVGGLYRRSIHDRFGYYDSSLHAAGDTEFKCRLLPYVRTKAIPRTLGIFLNYPDARATENPRAEIEDLRAWYLHRTPAGIRYGFDRRDPHEALHLFYRCLDHHKSFWRHRNTDVEYAAGLADYLARRSPGLVPPKHAAIVRRLLDAYRALDWLPGISRLGPAAKLLAARYRALQAQAYLTRSRSCPVRPVFQILNDNRFIQHRMVWKSDHRGEEA